MNTNFLSLSVRLDKEIKLRSTSMDMDTYTTYCYVMSFFVCKCKLK